MCKVPQFIKADFPENPLRYFRYSPLMGLFQSMVFLVWWLSLIEYIKLFASWLAWRSAEVAYRTRDFSEQRRAAQYTSGHRFALKRVKTARSFAIDLYEVGKWAVVIWFVVFSIQNRFALILIVYLLASNLFSHFYYHIWHENSLKGKIGALQSRRRFLSFVLALVFSFVAYSYVFSVFRCSFDWPEGHFSTINSLFFSISNAFTLVYGDTGPNDASGYYLAASQVAYTFFFVVIIIVQSIPTKEAMRHR